MVTSSRVSHTETRTSPEPTPIHPDSAVTETVPDGVTASAGLPDSAQRAFNLAIVFSGIRCLLAYILLPFATPFLGLAPGVGPALGLAISSIAIVANLVSLRRFLRSSHRWRKPVIAIHVVVISFLIVLVGIDLVQLAG